jgi:integrase
LVKGELTLPGSITKNKKTRTIPLNSEAVNVLMQLRQAGYNAGRVFPNAPGSGFSLVNVSKTISKICDQIGVPDATMHATRRTFN